MTSSLRCIWYKTVRLGNCLLYQRPPQTSMTAASGFNLKLQIMTTQPISGSHQDSLSTAMDGLLLTVKPSTQTSRSVIIRHIPGEERFQMKLIHKNKVFNFDRSASDSMQALMDRMVANLSKKMKTWDGVVALLTSPPSCSEHTESDRENFVEIVDKSAPVATLLQQIISGVCQLNIKISEDIYDVVINPPEIFSIKFLKQAVAGFPIIPYKIEASSNFDRNASKYLWEFTRDPKKTVATVSKKKNQQNMINSTIANPTNSEKGWISTGCTDYIFTPEKDLVGARLRLTCVPSNANGFGLPFFEEVPEIVSSLPVNYPVFMERLERILIDFPAAEDTRGMISNANLFRLVSYNCLAECYATEEWFIASPKSALPADYRLPFLAKEFASYQGDVYCLQEIEDKYFERIFTPFFECRLNYKGFFSAKTGSVKEGVAMFYNPRKLESIKKETVVILEHLMTMSIWNKIPSAIVKRISERNSVLQVAIFRALSQQNTVIIIANTHLYFHPDADHIRLLQVASCLDFIETLASEIKKNCVGTRVCVMFCGDFNCTPPFSSFRYLTSGVIEENDFDWSSHPTEKLQPGLSLQHNLQLTNSNPEHELTNITTCFEGCIDYILYQSHNFDLISTYPPPDKTTLAKLCNLPETRMVSLPNLYAPSDHLPLIADFQLKPMID